MVFQSKIRLSKLYAFEIKVNEALLCNLVYRFKFNVRNGIYYGTIINYWGSRYYYSNFKKGKKPERKSNL